MNVFIVIGRIDHEDCAAIIGVRSSLSLALHLLTVDREKRINTSGAWDRYDIEEHTVDGSWVRDIDANGVVIT